MYMDTDCHKLLGGMSCWYLMIWYMHERVEHYVCGRFQRGYIVGVEIQKKLYDAIMEACVCKEFVQAMSYEELTTWWRWCYKQGGLAGFKYSQTLGWRTPK